MQDKKYILEIYEMFKRNLPFIIREKEIVLSILGNRDNIIITRDDGNGRLIAAAVANNSTILLLCVDKEYQNRGIGSGLLCECENIFIKNGFNKFNAGLGFDYIMPGVPAARSYYKAENEGLSQDINNIAADFFAKRGYIHSCNCDFFDMKISLRDFIKDSYNIGDVIDGVIYKWATEDNINGIYECTDDAYGDFTKYYRNKELYNSSSKQKVLVALCNSQVAGTLIVNSEDTGNSTGCFGCLTVRHAYQGKYIAVNLITIGTKYLKDMGFKEAFIGYTYSGLEHLYGYAGYKIWVYYMMAAKEVENGGNL